MPYEYLDNVAPIGGRVHFKSSSPDDDPDAYVTPARLAAQGIAFAYLDAASVTEYEALNSLAKQLRTDHPPYEPNPHNGMPGWYRFMDDLETLSFNEPGMIIIIDNAAGLFRDPASWVFQLLTIWVLQLPGWQRRGVPCHLAFQMEPDPTVKAIYGSL